MISIERGVGVVEVVVGCQAARSQSVCMLKFKQLVSYEITQARDDGEQQITLLDIYYTSVRQVRVDA